MSKDLETFRTYAKSLTREQAEAIVRKVMGPPKRELEGKEYKDIWLLLQLATPFSESNNQHSWSEEYEMGGKIYHVTYGIEDKPIIQELLENDI